MCVHHAVCLCRTHLYSLWVFVVNSEELGSASSGYMIICRLRRRNIKVSGWTLSVAFLLEPFTRVAPEISCIEWRLPDASSDSIERTAVALQAFLKNHKASDLLFPRVTNLYKNYSKSHEFWVRKQIFIKFNNKIKIYIFTRNTIF